MNNVSYRENLYRTFSAYRKSALPDGDELFEARADDGKSPTLSRRPPAVIGAYCLATERSALALAFAKS